MTIQPYYSKAQYDQLLEQLHNTQEQLEYYYMQHASAQKTHKAESIAATKQYEKTIARLKKKLKAAEERSIAAEALANKLQSDLHNIQNSTLWKTAKPVIALKALTQKRGQARKQLLQEANILKDSGLFDSAWYLSQYPDVAASNTNPIAHYLEYGAAEGRNPSSTFNSNGYKERYPDIAHSGVNPLLHYALYGKAEGRSCSPKPGNKKSSSASKKGGR